MDRIEIPDHVRRALGDQLSTKLVEVASQAQSSARDLDRRWTTEFWVIPMSPENAIAWERDALQRGENWRFIQRSDGSLLAVDEVPDHDPSLSFDAVVFPSLLSQLSSWWLFHAWRGMDLIVDAVAKTSSWQMTTAPLAARALIEQVGCLAYEAGKLASAWKIAKSGDLSGAKRVQHVQESLQALLRKFTLGTRMAGRPDEYKAISVLTYVQKLARLTQDARYETWYDWLSDASHPAFGSRIASAGEPRVHESGAVVVRFFSRGTLVTVPVNGEGAAGIEQGRPEFNEVASNVAESVVTAAKTYFTALQSARHLVDDFALTTNAATLTLRQLWPALTRSAPGDLCPCDCGARDYGSHVWGGPAPHFEL